MVSKTLQENAGIINTLANDLVYMSSNVINDDVTDELREASAKMTEILCELIGHLSRGDDDKVLELKDSYLETNKRLMEIIENHCD